MRTSFLFKLLMKSRRHVVADSPSSIRLRTGTAFAAALGGAHAPSRAGCVIVLRDVDEIVGHIARCKVESSGNARDIQISSRVKADRGVGREGAPRAASADVPGVGYAVPDGARREFRCTPRGHEPSCRRRRRYPRARALTTRSRAANCRCPRASARDSRCRSACPPSRLCRW